MPARPTVPLSRRARLVSAVVAILLVLGLAPTVTDAQTGLAAGNAGQVAPGVTFGIGGATNVTGLAAVDVINSAYSLAQVDPVTGHLVGDHVGEPGSIDAAMAMDLMTSGQLAVDAAEIARQAQAEIARRRTARRETGVALDRSANPGSPSPDELDTFTGECHPSNATWQARIETVAAFTAMCRAAASDGVTLQLNSAYRSPARQHQLFRSAVARYGSESAARKWVAWSDGTSCSSRHCSGQALDISRAHGAHTWLHTTAGCWHPTGQIDMGRTSCPTGTRPVRNGNLYGFVAPMDHEPWHWEIGIPLAGYIDDPNAGPGNTGYADCSPSSTQQIPAIVAQIFRCKLRAAGYPEDRVTTIVAEALMVSKCESSWDPRIRSSRSSARGLWQFLRGSAHWIEGGYEAADDPVRSTVAAANYFIAVDDRQVYSETRGSKGWRPWACTAWLNDGSNHNVFRNGIADWAYDW